MEKYITHVFNLLLTCRFENCLYSNNTPRN